MKWANARGKAMFVGFAYVNFVSVQKDFFWVYSRDVKKKIISEFGGLYGQSQSNYKIYEYLILLV